MSEEAKEEKNSTDLNELVNRPGHRLTVSITPADSEEDKALLRDTKKQDALEELRQRRWTFNVTLVFGFALLVGCAVVALAPNLADPDTRKFAQEALKVGVSSGVVFLFGRSKSKPDS